MSCICTSPIATERKRVPDNLKIMHFRTSSTKETPTCRHAKNKTKKKWLPGSGEDRYFGLGNHNSPNYHEPGQPLDIINPPINVLLSTN